MNNNAATKGREAQVAGGIPPPVRFCAAIERTLTGVSCREGR